jgi:peptide chain release factor 2
MFEINPVKNRIQDLTERSDVLRGIFDYDAKKERLEEVNAELEQPDVWNEPERAQALGKERSSLEAIVDTLDQMARGWKMFPACWSWLSKPTTKKPLTKP